mmetsp:Transcript_41658/g.114968  ORF Transcript_41658/g.114968 Transcript_41658/m.114968 type:complete len:217 (+) Transcript_41658:687-1337(+)
MRIEEASNRPRMREVVVDRAEALLKALKAVVQSQPRAIHLMPNFTTMRLQLLNRLIDLLVALTQLLQGLERCRDHAPMMPQGLPMLCEKLGEGQIRVAEHKRVAEGVSDLHAHDPAHRRAPDVIRRNAGHHSLYRWLRSGLLRHLLQGAVSVVLLEDAPQVLVRQTSQKGVLVLVDIPAPPEDIDGVQRTAAWTQILALLDEVIVYLLRDSSLGVV